jgi:hypothetical protein
MVLAAVQNSVNCWSVLMLTVGLHSAMRSMISESPGMSMTQALVMPNIWACCITVVVGCKPLLDS